MRETFDQYRKIIESNVIEFTYLYDGDVISSSNCVYSNNIANPTTSPKFVIECIKDIYNKSISKMINNSIEINVENSNDYFNGKKTYKDLSKFINSMGFDPSYFFISENSFRLFQTRKFTNDNKVFPNYFYTLMDYSSGFKVYYSPNVLDHSDELNIYVTDRSIQSLVYTIQNMEYKIESKNDLFDSKHSINYPLYDCDYICYKLVIKDINKIRDEKLSSILDGN